jgi:hypothetical protein
MQKRSVGVILSLPVQLVALCRLIEPSTFKDEETNNVLKNSMPLLQQTNIRNLNKVEGIWLYTDSFMR